MARKIINVCDVCESDDRVKTYEVRADGEKAKIDVCHKHGELFAAALKGFETATPSTRSTARGGSGRRPSRYRADAGENGAQAGAQGTSGLDPLRSALTQQIG